MCLAENYWEDTLLSYSMDGEIRSMIRNIENRWKKIGNNGRETRSPDIVGTHS